MTGNDIYFRPHDTHAYKHPYPYRAIHFTVNKHARTLKQTHTLQHHMIKMTYNNELT